MREYWITLFSLILILVKSILANFPDLNGTQAERCYATCGRRQRDLELWHGAFKCTFLEYYDLAVVNQWCWIECMGFRPAEDQTECYCKFCNQGGTNVGTERTKFCRYPGMYVPGGSCPEVCQGKLTYHDEYCYNSFKIAKAELRYGTSRRDGKTCFKKCGGRRTWLKELWAGLHVCGRSAEDREIHFNTRCYMDCMGSTVAEDQMSCACEACRNTGENGFRPDKGYYKGFCEKPGVGVSIEREKCDELVCSGNMTYRYFGQLCDFKTEAELEEAKQEFGTTSTNCVEKFGGRHQWYLELWDGLHVCAYMDGQKERPAMNPVKFYECEGIEIAEDQNQCKADYCKTHSLNYDDFCSHPGVNTFINKKDCDALVLTGKANYHGYFCRLSTPEEVAKAEQMYGDTHEEKHEKCEKDCQGVFDKQIFQRKVSCVYPHIGKVAKDPEFFSQCYVQCMGHEVASDQNKCACDFCKLSTDAKPTHEMFCSERGMNTFVGKDECESKVCTGLVSYNGQYCKISEDDLIIHEEKYDEAAIQKFMQCEGGCGGPRLSQRNEWKGLYHCYEDRWDPSRRKMMPICVADCLPTVRSGSNQHECACSICRKDDEDGNSNSLKFCKAPGSGGLEKSQCSLVCQGQAKYYGEYCSKNEEELREVQGRLGPRPGETFLRNCRQTCDVDGNSKEKKMFKGELVCAHTNLEGRNPLGNTATAECPCYLKCAGYYAPETPEDQNKCMCQLCKGPNGHKGFCAAPGPQAYIGEDECDAKVCTGEVKYYGDFCDKTQAEIDAFKEKNGV